MKLCVLLAGSGLALFLAMAAPASADETITYRYDALGRLIAVQSTGTVNNGQARSVCYDAAGNRTLYRSDSAGGVATCAGGSAPPAPTPTPTPTPPPASAPSIAIADAVASEGGALSFAVTLSAASATSITVTYATAYGSAGSGDIVPVSGTLTFSPGQTSRTISVSTRNDTRYEDTEDFIVNLSSPSGGATIADGQGVGTIYDDDEYREPTCGQYLC